MLSIIPIVLKCKILLVYLLQHCGGWLPDRCYLKWLFRLEMGRELNLKAPKTFCEKLQWLKLYNRKPEYTTMVDKYAVKKYVARIIGNEFIIPILGVWNNPEDIEWDKLPERFVLKTTHGGGGVGVVVCRNKERLDRDKAIDKLKKSMQQDIYKRLREWPYKDVPKRIIAEQYLEPRPGVENLADYKWYCFNGEPKFCQVIQDRNAVETIDFFDTEWQHLDFVGLNPKACQAIVMPPRPTDLDKQLYLAKQLSKGIPFVRIDLYNTNNGIFFGEITFYPRSGFGTFNPVSYDQLLGQMILLP